jgi:hypothetical protein
MFIVLDNQLIPLTDWPKMMLRVSSVIAWIFSGSFLMLWFLKADSQDQSSTVLLWFNLWSQEWFFSAFVMCFFVSVQSFPPSGIIFATLGHSFVSNLFFNRILTELVFCKIFIRFILYYKWVLTVLIYWVLAILVFIDWWLLIFFILTFILIVIVILIFLNRVWKVFIFFKGIVTVFP